MDLKELESKTVFGCLNAKATKNIWLFFLLVIIGMNGCSKNSPSPTKPVTQPKAITSFNFEGLLTIVEGTIIEGVENTITLKVNYDVSLKSLVPSIKFLGASVTPASGIPQDFSKPVLYTVTANDGSIAVYKVFVIVYSPLPNTLVHWTLNNGIKRSVFSMTSSGKNFFAGTDSGIFRTYNYEKWISMGLATSTVNALISKGSNLIAGTTNGIFISSDSANTWVPRSLGLTNQNVLSLAIASDMVYAGTSEGAYMSNNNGDSWVLITSGSTSTLPVYSILAFGNSILIGTDDGIFSSADGGVNWVHDGFVNITITSLMIANSDIYAGSGGLGYGGSISASSDGGISWSYINNGLVSGQHIYSIVSGSSGIYAGTAFGPYVSVNNGVNWQSIGLTFEPVYSFLMDGNNLFVGTANGVYLRQL